MKKVFFHMATMPSRQGSLKYTLPRMLSQCDHLYIYLNEFDSVPDFLIHPKITTFLSGEHLGDLGDVGKFYLCDSWKNMDAYIFTVDDKIILPSDFTKRSIDTIQRYDGKAVVSFHGRNIKPNCTSYYFDYEQFFCVYDSVISDTFVHELGTGVLSFDSRLIEIPMSCFQTINMTDIWFSLFLQNHNIPMVVARHYKGEFRMAKYHDDNYSIHSQCNKNDSFQTSVINSHQWKIHKI